MTISSLQEWNTYRLLKAEAMIPAKTSGFVAAGGCCEPHIRYMRTYIHT